MIDKELQKENVGIKATKLIKDGQVVGLGTGSTTQYFIKHLGKRIQEEELDIIGIPTSYQSLITAKDVGIKTGTLDEYDIDLAVDGADEIDSNMDLIKGGGAAHTLEKLIDSAAKEFIVIIDESKSVEKLGRFPVPIEIIPEALRIVKKTLTDINGFPELRMGINKDGPVITDNGNFILDTKFEEINNPKELESILNSIPGVLENGIFAGIVDQAIIGQENDIKTKYNENREVYS